MAWDRSDRSGDYARRNRCSAIGSQARPYAQRTHASTQLCWRGARCADLCRIHRSVYKRARALEICLLLAAPTRRLPARAQRPSCMLLLDVCFGVSPCRLPAGALGFARPLKTALAQSRPHRCLSCWIRFLRPTGTGTLPLTPGSLRSPRPGAPNDSCHSRVLPDRTSVFNHRWRHLLRVAIASSMTAPRRVCLETKGDKGTGIRATSSPSTPYFKGERVSDISI